MASHSAGWMCCYVLNYRHQSDDRSIQTVWRWWIVELMVKPIAMPGEEDLRIKIEISKQTVSISLFLSLSHEIEELFMHEITHFHVRFADDTVVRFTVQ